MSENCFHCQKINDWVILQNNNYNKFCYSCYKNEELFDKLTSFSKITAMMMEFANQEKIKNINGLLEEFYIFLFITDLYKKIEFRTEEEKQIVLKYTSNIKPISHDIQKKIKNLYDLEVLNDFLYHDNKTDETLFRVFNIFMDSYSTCLVKIVDY